MATKTRDLIAAKVERESPLWAMQLKLNLKHAELKGKFLEKLLELQSRACEEVNPDRIESTCRTIQTEWKKLKTLSITKNSLYKLIPHPELADHFLLASRLFLEYDFVISNRRIMFQQTQPYSPPTCKHTFVCMQLLSELSSDVVENKDDTYTLIDEQQIRLSATMPLLPHINLGQGQPVLLAGEASFSPDGELISWNQQSGTYHTPPSWLELSARCPLLNRLKFESFSWVESNTPPSVTPPIEPITPRREYYSGVKVFESVEDTLSYSHSSGKLHKVEATRPCHSLPTSPRRGPAITAHLSSSNPVFNLHQ